MMALYFIQTGAAAGLVKFLPVYFADEPLSFSATTIGILSVVGAVANFIGGIVWGRFADLTGRYKATMILTNAVSVVSIFGLLLKPVQNAFILFIGVFVLYCFFGSCWGTLVDAVAVIGDDAGEGSYGGLRLWAAVGWGVFAVVSGVLIDAFGIGSIFATFGFGMAISTAIVARYFSDPRKTVRPSLSNDVPGDDKLRITIGDENKSDVVFLRTEVAILLLNLLIQGILVAFVETFLYIYLVEVYNCPGYFLGLCTFVAAVFECPVFYYAEALIAKFGVKGLLTIAQMLYVVRVFAYIYIPRGSGVFGYWLFLATEPLHAFVFAAMWSAAVEYAKILAPPEHQGLMQVALNAIASPLLLFPLLSFTLQ